MNNNKINFEDIKFNIPPRTISNDIEGIPTKDMPKRMNEMFESVFEHTVKKIHEELNEIRGVEGKEDRVKYLEELLAAWS